MPPDEADEQDAAPAPPAASVPRRDLLIAGAAGAALFAFAPGCRPPPPPPGDDGPPPIDPDAYDHAVEVDFDPAALPEDDARFALGVQAGAMTDGAALLWTHVGDTEPVRLRVWRELPQPGRVALVLDEAVTPGDAGYLHRRVEPLAPATWYRFAFFTATPEAGAGGALTARTVVGRFRTAFPESWAEPVTVGATSCTHFSRMPYVALARTAEEPIDLFVHLGDMSYNDAAYYLGEYRTLWRRTLQDPGYRALLSQVGLYVTWDDHELANNLDPEAMAQQDPAHLAAGKQAFFETLAVERGDDDRLWRSYLWGRTAEFFVLDSRTERRPSTRDSAEAVYLGETQLSWLLDSLAASPAHFKVLLNSVPMANFPPPIWGGQADRWQGYDAQRRRLLEGITARGVKNVWALSGDFHLGFAVRLEQEGPWRSHWEIAVGPGGNGNNPLTLVAEGNDPKNRELVFPAAQFAYVSGRTAVTTLTFDPKRDAVRVRFLDPATGEARWDQWLSQRD